MVKRKVKDEEEEEMMPSKRSQKQKNKVLKEDSDSDFDVKKDEDEEEEEEDELEDDEPLNKKTKKTPGQKSTKADESSNEPTIKTNSEGDKFLDLGKKKRATVRSFKGIPLLDIREFYGNEGEEKPGKKGISLTLDQWETLRKNTAALDELFAKLKKK